MQENDHATPGLMASVRRLLRSIVAGAQNRFELLALELEEERGRLVGALLLAAAIIVFALLTLVMLTFTIVYAVDPEHRLTAAAVVSAVYLLATLTVAWRLRVKLKNWSAFSATRAELQKDREWLEGKDLKN